MTERRQVGLCFSLLSLLIKSFEIFMSKLAQSIKYYDLIWLYGNITVVPSCW